MNIRKLLLPLLFVSLASAQEAINPGRPANYPEIQDVPSLESLRKAKASHPERADWWREARFGMFVHWGVSSVLGGSFHGKQYPGYAEHIQRVAKIPIPIYLKEVAGEFNPVKFDADAWVRLARDSGMRYFIITAKHHDGIAMYDSKVSDKTIVKASAWKQDPMPALREACRKYGIKFGFYYSQAFDWGEENGAGNDWDFQNPGGDRLLHGSQWWVNYPEFLPKTRSYVDRKAIPQILELIRNYQPDIMWFDTPHKIPDEENLRILAAIRKEDPRIVVNGRLFDNPSYYELVDYINSGDKPSEFAPQKLDWEGLPTTNNSYGYSAKDNTHKPPQHFVRLLAKASALGGNILLNMGPMADGTVDPKDVSIFTAIGDWMKVNEEAIRGTSKGVLPAQPWGVTTAKATRLYLHVLDWPADGKLLVSGLKTEPSGIRVLGVPGLRLQTRRLSPLDVELSGLPGKVPDAADTVIALDFDGSPQTDPAVFVSGGGVTRISCMDTTLGGGLRYRAGRNAGDAWVVNWKAAGDSATWSIRTRQKASFQVSLVYDVPEAVAQARKVEGDAGKELVKVQKAAGGSYTISLGGQTLTREVGVGRTVTDKLGRITLEEGKSEVRLSLRELAGEELFRLRAIVFEPSP